MENKPRVRFCWDCGNKLRGNHFEEMEIDGHQRVLHKICATYLKEGAAVILDEVHESEEDDKVRNL